MQMWENKVSKAIEIIEGHINNLGEDNVVDNDILCWIYVDEECNLINEVYEHFKPIYVSELRYMEMPTGEGNVFSKAELYQILNILNMIHFSIIYD